MKLYALIQKNFKYKFFIPLISSIFIILTIESCGAFSEQNSGDIIGKSTNAGWDPRIPHGMVAIPSGTFTMGGGVNQGIIENVNVRQRKTITKFYMDEAVVTNAQYREFIDIVRKNPEEYGLDETYINEKLMPDMTVWQKDFSDMFMGDSLIENYYTHPGFDNYPVVGITWEAAQHYARVRSIYRNKYLEAKGLAPAPSFRLPTAAEWEYAAKGGVEDAQYPWGGPSVRDEKGNILANFQVTQRNYAESRYTYTSPVKSFPPNQYGLYDMAGNVAEWCEDAYSPIMSQKSSVINPIYRDNNTDFRVIKGGSWKDFSYSLQTGVIDFEHKDVARCYIGFRCIMPTI